MSTINYTYNVIVDRFRQFAAGHFQLRRFTHGEISQADLEKEAEWPWLHVKPRAINYSPGTRSFSFEIFISDLPRDKEDKTGYQAESITDCSLIFQDLINEIYLGNMFGSDVVLTRPVNAEPFVEQYTHTLTGVTGTIELNLDYDWSACSIPASWNYNTPTDSGTDGWGALQFIESLDQNGVFVSLLNDVEAPGNSYYYGTNASGVKGWYAIVDNVGLTCETLPDCATIISIVDDIAALQTDKVDKIAGKGLSTEDYTTAEKSKLAGIQAGAEVNVNADWNAVSGDAQILNKPTIPAQYNPTAGTGVSITGTYPNQTITNTAPDQVVALTAGTNIGVTGTYPNFTISNTQSLAGYVPTTRSITINGTTQDLSADRTFSVGTVTSVAALTLGTTGTDLSSTVANSTSTPVITLNVPTASATNRGVLSSADWSTFNGKFTLPSLTSGSVLFSNGTTIAQDNANLFWDDTNNRLGIGTATPATTVQIAGTTTTQSVIPVTDSTYNLGTSSLRFNFLYLRGLSTTGNSLDINAGNINLNNDAGAIKARLIGATGNFLIGSSTDAGFRLDVNGTARVQGNAQFGTGFYWDNTNNRLGINTASPSQRLTVIGVASTAPTNSTWISSGSPIGSFYGEGAIGNMDFFIGGASSTALSRPVLVGRKSGGTLAVPTALAIGDSVFSFLSSGYSGTQFLNTASINMLVDGTVSSTSVPQAITFETGTTSRSERMRIASSGNLLVGTTTDAGYKLDVNGTARIQNQLITTGSISAASAVARGTYLNQTLVATANNDTLYGLDIFPTFNTGSFTGVNSVAMRIRNASGNIFYLDSVGNATLGASLGVGSIYSTANMNFSSGSGDLRLQSNFNVNTGLTMFRNTRNFVIQDGGTFTDAGYRLDVQGTSRFTGGAIFNSSMTIGGATAINNSLAVGTNQPAVASAQLEVVSTTRGFLPPRQTLAQRTAIASPAVGLIVYQTDLVEGLYVYKSTGWQFIA